MNFEEFRKLLEERLGVTRLADIARELEVSPQSVSNWKARDRVPYKYVKLIRKEQHTYTGNDFQREEPKQSESNSDRLLIDNSAFNDLSFSFIDYLNAIVDNIKLVLIIPICLGLFTLIYTQFSYTPVFESTARLVLEKADKDNFSGGFNRILGGSSESKSSDLTSTALFPQFIRTRFFAKRIFEEKFYTERFNERLPLLAILSYGKGQPIYGIDTLITQTMPRLQQMIQFENEGSFTLLKVQSFESKLSADIANRTILELKELSQYFKNQQVLQTKEFIESRIETVGQELEHLEDELKNFRKSNRRLEQSPTLLLDQERLKRKVDIHKGMFLTLKQQLELTKIEEIQDEYLFKVLDYPIPPLGPMNSKDTPFLLSIIIGFFLAIAIAITKENFVELFGKKYQKIFIEINFKLKKNLLDIFSNRNPIILINIILFCGQIVLLGHQSTNPIFFGKYSLKALIIIFVYFIGFIASIFINIYFYKIKYYLAKRLAISN